MYAAKPFRPIVYHKATGSEEEANRRVWSKIELKRAARRRPNDRRYPADRTRGREVQMAAQDADIGV